VRTGAEYFDLYQFHGVEEKDLEKFDFDTVMFPLLAGHRTPRNDYGPLLELARKEEVQVVRAVRFSGGCRYGPLVCTL